MIPFFLGKFDPIHNGHITTAEKIRVETGMLPIFGIVPTVGDKFTYQQRREMIQAVYNDAKVLPVPLITEKDNKETTRKKIPSGAILYTGSISNVRMYKLAGYEAKYIERSGDISSSVVRRLIRSSDKEWEKLVPAEVVEVIEEVISNPKSKN